MLTYVQYFSLIILFLISKIFSFKKFAERVLILYLVKALYLNYDDF